MKKVISTLLSLSMVIGVVAPVQASEITNSIGSVKEDITNEAVTGQDTAQGQKSEYQEAGTDENGTNVYLTKVSTYTVTIPKTIILDGETDTGHYAVKVAGNFAGKEQVVVMPNETFTMSQDGKDDIYATVEQDKTEWKYNETDIVGTGTVQANDATAGSWNGSFNFNINLETEEKEIEYTEFTLTKDNYAMAGITSLEGDVVIPETFVYDGKYYKITSIGNQGFYCCGNITSIKIPSSVTSIGVDAFRQCTNLTSIVIQEGVTSIGALAFYGCTNLTSVVIPEGVKTIERQVFQECINLTNVEIPDSVTSIGDYAFHNIPHITYNGTATGSPWGALSIN